MKTELHCTHSSGPVAKPYHYTECGLDNVFLRNGFETDGEGVDAAICVRDADELHRVIGVHLASEKKVLTGKELRFLRNEMDVTQEELGSLVGATSQSIARWEKGQTPVNDSAESLIRLLYLEFADEHKGIRDLLTSLDEEDETFEIDQVFELEGEWKPKIAA
jgi:putative transcriptional regulator